MRVDNMPAGREMDALVAEKVMGWTDIQWQTFPGENGEEVKAFARGVSPIGDLRVIVPNYSTDITAAWEAAEKIPLKYTEGYVSVTRTAAGNPQYLYDCVACNRIYDSGGWAEPERFSVVGHADTAPLAICRAALKAMGIEEV